MSLIFHEMVASCQLDLANSSSSKSNYPVRSLLYQSMVHN